MLISERIFEKLNNLTMTQKEFSERTGIRQSTISEWKKKHTNPSADKILIICDVLGVSAEWLLSGTDIKEGARNQTDWYVIGRNTELGHIIEQYNHMDIAARTRLLGYLDALADTLETS